mgnify:CR=1 FL=1
MSVGVGVKAEVTHAAHIGLGLVQGESSLAPVSVQPTGREDGTHVHCLNAPSINSVFPMGHAPGTPVGGTPEAILTVMLHSPPNGLSPWCIRHLNSRGEATVGVNCTSKLCVPPFGTEPETGMVLLASPNCFSDPPPYLR